MARVVFLGTPSFGVPVLEALVRHHEVVAVVTQPDRPAGRGRRTLEAPEVKRAAQRHGLRVLQPVSLRRDRGVLRELRAAGADVFVLAAYGQILRQEVLEIPPHGCIGVHASLLPKWRGAAPIAAAILHGERETGMTLMRTDAGMDTGDIIAQEALTIAHEDTTATLTERLAHLGARLLIDTLPRWLAGEIDPRPQDDAQATYAPMISRDDARIDWGRSAREIERLIRAYTPWPGAHTTLDGETLKVVRAHPTSGGDSSALPGTVIEVDPGIGVQTGEGMLALDVVQLAGRRAMEAIAFARGRRGFIGSVLGARTAATGE
jgi:methionyl-tRNA formyltransferase